MGLVDNDTGSIDIVSDCLEEEDMTFSCKPEKMSCRFLRTIKDDLVEWVCYFISLKFPILISQGYL